MWRIAICDNEQWCVDVIEERVRRAFEENFNDTEYTIETYTSGAQLIVDFDTKNFNVVFLDIQMPIMDGITVAKRLREMDPGYALVFVTAFDDYKFDADELEPIKYVRKNKPNDYKIALERIMRLGQTDYLKFPGASKSESIIVEDILYFVSDRHNLTAIDTMHNSASGEMSFSDLLTNDLYKDFAMCHKKYAVNLKYIANIKPRQLRLSTGDDLPVGRAYAKSIELAQDDYLRRARL